MHETAAPSELWLLGDRGAAYQKRTFLIQRIGALACDGRQLKRDDPDIEAIEHRQAKYLECDHGKLKRLIQPTLGFQSMKTAYATIKVFEVMRMFKKGQFVAWIDAIGGGTEAFFVNWLLGLYA